MEVNTANLESNREQWASIDGYRNYEVSWWGRVRNIDTNRILKGCMTIGYLRVVLCKNGKRKSHSIHQLVAREWASNPEGKRCVDHVDNDRTNNNWENLRCATHAENNQNATKTNKVKSWIYKGVRLNKSMNKFMAHIRINGKLKHLGCFESEREAGKAYKAAAAEQFGKFAKLNIFED